MGICHAMALHQSRKVSVIFSKISLDSAANEQLAVTGLGAAYGLEAEIAAVLAAYAVAIDGNVVEQVWSIGGPLPADFLGGLIGTGQG